VVAGNGIIRAGCWAHLRRKVIDAEKAAPEIARQAIEMVRALYAVEKQAATVSATKRLEMRQARSVPLLAELRDKFLAWKEQLLPRHPMAEAISYAMSQWRELNVFSSDGAVPIDNNVSEREMKRVVLNRELALRRQPARWSNGSNPGQPNKYLPAPRCGPAALHHAVARQPA
jgi:transposase